MASALVITYKKNIWGIPAWIPFIKKEHKCAYPIDAPTSDHSLNQEVRLAQLLNMALISNKLGDNITQVDVRFHDGVLFIDTSQWDLPKTVFNVDASAPVVLHPFTRFNSFNTTASVDFSRAKIFQVKHFGYYVDVCTDANLERAADELYWAKTIAHRNRHKPFPHNSEEMEECRYMTGMHIACANALLERRTQIGLLDELDTARLDWLADRENALGNVQLPTECVQAHPENLRAAIDAAMSMEGGAATSDDMGTLCIVCNACMILGESIGEECVSLAKTAMHALARRRAAPVGSRPLRTRWRGAAGHRGLHRPARPATGSRHAAADDESLRRNAQAHCAR